MEGHRKNPGLRRNSDRRMNDRNGGQGLWPKVEIHCHCDM